MSKIFLVFLCMLLSGCASLDFLENRVSCSVDGKQAYVNSMYGPVGVTSKVAKADAAVICGKGG